MHGNKVAQPWVSQAILATELEFPSFPRSYNLRLSLSQIVLSLKVKSKPDSSHVYTYFTPSSQLSIRQVIKQYGEVQSEGHGRWRWENMKDGVPRCGHVRIRIGLSLAIFTSPGWITRSFIVPYLIKFRPVTQRDSSLVKFKWHFMRVRNGSKVVGRTVKGSMPHRRKQIYLPFVGHAHEHPQTTPSQLLLSRLHKLFGHLIIRPSKELLRRQFKIRMHHHRQG